MSIDRLPLAIANITANFAVIFAMIFGALCLTPFAASATTANRGQPAQNTATATRNHPPDQKAFEVQSNDITRKGSLVLVSRAFADAVKKDNTAVLSTIAVKSQVDQKGQLRGFQLFQIDRGSPVTRMGFKAKDVVVGVNGIPVRELEANRQSLEKEHDFNVAILRNGKEKKIRILIR